MEDNGDRTYNGDIVGIDFFPGDCGNMMGIYWWYDGDISNNLIHDLGLPENGVAPNH